MTNALSLMLMVLILLVSDEIIRIEAEGNYSKIFLTHGKCRMVTKTLKDFEDSLPEQSFFRVHKSHIVNLKYVKEYSNT